MRRAVQLFRLHGINDDRKLLALSCGLKSTALKWLDLGEMEPFRSLVELSQTIRPGRQSDTMETAFNDPTGVPASVLYLHLCQAFVDTDLPDLATIMFLKCGDIRLARRAAVQVGAIELFEFAVQAVAGFLCAAEPEITNQEPPAPDVDDRSQDRQSNTGFVKDLTEAVPPRASFWGHVAHQLGLMKKSKKVWEEAGTRFRQAIELNANYGYSRLELAGIFARRGSYSHAFKEFKHAVAVEPECVVSYTMDLISGLAQNHSSSLAKALTRFRKSRSFQTVSRIIWDAATRVINSFVGGRHAG
jgi:tetratricopeptide (TPR) repeat protein